MALLAGVALADESAGPRADVVLHALSLLGTPYRFGGSAPASGLDCSGLVRYVFTSALKRELPRRSEEISTVGQPIGRAELQPGDLVFFNTLRRAFSHVAIYIGEGRFVHAPAGKGRVRIEGLDDAYWAARFNGARRLIDEPAASAMLMAAPRPVSDATLRSPGPWSDRPPEP